MTKIYIAPIAGVTDYTYRGILKEFNPDMLFTEMVSINAMECASEKTLKVILRLREGDSVQLFGKDIVFCSEAYRTSSYGPGIGKTLGLFFCVFFARHGPNGFGFVSASISSSNPHQ